jgi:glycosyltransferase involved in cell wall biosynthesis
MLKLIISAYACAPNMGSEQGIGWNWCVQLARHCELHIITESEYQERIEAARSTLEQGERMHFHFLPVTEKVRRMCWNQGDWRFYIYYKKWQQQAADMARDICRQEKIDILHQVNMQGFREPGYLWQVSQETGIPFVWGPIGGMKQFPMAYAKDGSWKMRCFMGLKNRLNTWQLKHNRRVDNAMKQASLLISSIPDSYRAIKEVKGLESVWIADTGTVVDDGLDDNANFNLDLNLNVDDNPDVDLNLDDKFDIVWAGKFDFRKRLDLALKALVETGSQRIRLKVLGSGNQRQETEAKALAERLGMAGQVEWMGSIPNSQVKEEMRKANLFLFTSVNEETSTVVMEAISNRLPILCFDCCGMSAVVTDEVGKKIPLTTPEQSVKDFAEAISYLYNHREVLAQMSENCKRRAEQLSWESKAQRMVEMYKNLNPNPNLNLNGKGS